MGTADRDDSGAYGSPAATHDPRAWALTTRNGKSCLRAGFALVVKGLLTTASAPGVFSLLANLPVRFRTYPSANPFWAANIAVINALRAITPFAAATQSIVDDSTTPPKMFGYPFEESTTMDGALTTGGHKGLILLDGNSYLIVDRIGTQMIYEPPASTARAPVSPRSARSGGEATLPAAAPPCSPPRGASSDPRRGRVVAGFPSGRALNPSCHAGLYPVLGPA